MRHVVILIGCKKYLLNFILEYYGMDIVSDIIKNNNEKYSNSKIKFYKKILLKTYSQSDLVICRDF